MALSPVELIEWQALKKAISRESFAQRFAHPFLIRRLGAPRKPAAETGDFGDGIGFRTDVVDPSLDATPARTAVRLSGAIVLPVAKKPQNPYPDRISVGRALNCDVVVRDASVSKLHGHFVPVSASEAAIVDRESANGTKVNGTPVHAEPVRLTPGDTLVLGTIALQFLDAKRLWDLL